LVGRRLVDAPVYNVAFPKRSVDSGLSRALTRPEALKTWRLSSRVGIADRLGTMALLDRIKAQMFQAMKAGNAVEKEILKVAMGEITTDAARPDKKGDDAEALAILKKLVKSIEESISASQDETQKATLRAEIEVLNAYLPKALGVPEIVEALAPVADAVKAAGNDGQATGVAMKHLKTLEAEVNGKDVSAAVRQLRG
jgi:uncharacterized protein YqeY